MALKGADFIKDAIIARYGGEVKDAIAKFCVEYPEFEPQQMRDLFKGRSRPIGDFMLALGRALGFPHMPPEWWGWGDKKKPAPRSGGKS